MSHDLGNPWLRGIRHFSNGDCGIKLKGAAVTATQINSMKQFTLDCSNVSGEQNWENLFPLSQSTRKMHFRARLVHTEMQLALSLHLWSRQKQCWKRRVCWINTHNKGDVPHISLSFDLTVFWFLSFCIFMLCWFLTHWWLSFKNNSSHLPASFSRNQKERRKKRLTSKKLAEFLRAPQALNITHQRQCTDQHQNWVSSAPKLLCLCFGFSQILWGLETGPTSPISPKPSFRWSRNPL